MAVLGARGATEGTFLAASTAVRHTSTASLKSAALFPLNGSPSLHPGRKKRGCLSREVRPCTAAMLSAPGAGSRKCANDMQKRVFLGRTSDWVGDFSSLQKERTARYSAAKPTCATAEQVKIEETLALAARRVLSLQPTCLRFEPSAMLATCYNLTSLNLRGLHTLRSFCKCSRTAASLLLAMLLVGHREWRSLLALYPKTLLTKIAQSLRGLRHQSMLAQENVEDTVGNSERTWCGCIPL
jgi:hypothetical protein